MTEARMFYRYAEPLPQEVIEDRDLLKATVRLLKTQLEEDIPKDTPGVYKDYVQVLDPGIYRVVLEWYPRGDPKSPDIFS